jgi:hypothetical protein
MIWRFSLILVVLGDKFRFLFDLAVRKKNWHEGGILVWYDAWSRGEVRRGGSSADQQNGRRGGTIGTTPG